MRLRLLVVDLDSGLQLALSDAKIAAEPAHHQ